MGDDVPPIEGVHMGISAMESWCEGFSGKVCYWWKSSALIKSECRRLSSVRVWTPKCDLGHVCAHAKTLLSDLTLCDPGDCSSPGSSDHGDSSGKNTGMGCHVLLQGIFLTQGSNPHLSRLLHWQRGSLPLVPPGIKANWKWSNSRWQEWTSTF